MIDSDFADMIIKFGEKLMKKAVGGAIGVTAILVCLAELKALILKRMI